MNGSVSEHVVDFDLESPEGVVVDWVAHNLYWVDSGTRRVEMSHIDGSSRRVIVWRSVQPRSLAVDPAHGLVFLSRAVWWGSVKQCYNSSSIPSVSHASRSKTVHFRSVVVIEHY